MSKFTGASTAVVAGAAMLAFLGGILIWPSTYEWPWVLMLVAGTSLVVGGLLAKRDGM
jgi:hypothetical protein